MLGALFPLACPSCGESTSADAPVCERCSAGLRAPVAAPPPLGVDGWNAPFAYEGPARELVARVKYRNARAVVPWLATRMAATVDPPAGVVVTWAPTSRDRRRRRGFDPAEVLARAVARRLELRCVGLLDRLPGPAQTGLDAEARRRGPRFDPRSRVPASVLIVDDVATTGATLAAAAHALRAAGARTVGAVTAARTPPPR